MKVATRDMYAATQSGQWALHETTYLDPYAWKQNNICWVGTFEKKTPPAMKCALIQNCRCSASTKDKVDKRLCCTHSLGEQSATSPSEFSSMKQDEFICSLLSVVSPMWSRSTMPLRGLFIVKVTIFEACKQPRYRVNGPCMWLHTCKPNAWKLNNVLAWFCTCTANAIQAADKKH